MIALIVILLNSSIKIGLIIIKFMERRGCKVPHLIQRDKKRLEFIKSIIGIQYFLTEIKGSMITVILSILWILKIFSKKSVQLKLEIKITEVRFIQEVHRDLDSLWRLILYSIKTHLIHRPKKTFRIRIRRHLIIKLILVILKLSMGCKINIINFKCLKL